MTANDLVAAYNAARPFPELLARVVRDYVVIDQTYKAAPIASFEPARSPVDLADMLAVKPHAYGRAL